MTIDFSLPFRAVNVSHSCPIFSPLFHVDTECKKFLTPSSSFIFAHLDGNYLRAQKNSFNYILLDIRYYFFWLIS
jgi:hypothetical protein